MKHLGIDLGRKTSAICTVDHLGRPLKIVAARKVDSSSKVFVDLVAALGGKGKVKVTLEAGNCSFIYARKMAKAGADVYVVNPYSNALIRESRKKNDGRDAQELAAQRRKDMLPKHGVWVPTEEQEDLRRLYSARHYLVKQQTSLQNRVIRLADRHELYFENGALKWNPAWCEVLLAANAWAEVDKLLVAVYRKEHEELSAELKAVDRIIAIRAKELYAPQMALLSSIKGVGDTTSGEFLSRVCDFSRFATARELCAYAGLTPISRSSGKKKGSTRISKAGDAHLRGLILQAADSFTRWAPEDDPLKEWYEHLCRTRGWQKARVALARKLVSIFYGMLKTGQNYDPNKVRSTWGERYSKV